MLLTHALRVLVLAATDGSVPQQRHCCTARPFSTRLYSGCSCSAVIASRTEAVPLVLHEFSACCLVGFALYRCFCPVATEKVVCCVCFVVGCFPVLSDVCLVMVLRRLVWPLLFVVSSPFFVFSSSVTSGVLALPALCLPDLATLPHIWSAVSFFFISLTPLMVPPVIHLLCLPLFLYVCSCLWCVSVACLSS